MRRRRLLRSLGSGTTAGVAGCLGGASTDRGDTTRARGTGTDGTARAAEVDGTARATETGSDQSASGRRARTPAVCSESIRYDTQIVAIVDPAFGPNWEGVAVDSRYATAGNGALSPETTIVGVGTDTHARAYPLAVLTRHEIVNDTVGGTPLAVTYCPICRSGLVFERVVDGVRTAFAVSGLLWSPSSDGSLDESVVAFGADRLGGERGGRGRREPRDVRRGDAELLESAAREGHLWTTDWDRPAGAPVDRHDVGAVAGREPRRSCAAAAAHVEHDPLPGDRRLKGPVTEGADERRFASESTL